MVPTFDAYVFSGPVGKISPPIKSPLGYHIIQIEERKPAVKATLANSTDKITQMLKQQQESPLIQQFLQQQQQTAKIEVSDQRFAGLFPTPLPAASAPPAPAPATTK
jgi:peptidyl-prolyl cis-trans isomerase C